MTYEIRNDIPLPASTRAYRASKYPIAYLEVGECFIVPASDIGERGAVPVRAAVAQYKKSRGSDAKFTVRRMENGDVGVWRFE